MHNFLFRVGLVLGVRVPEIVFPPVICTQLFEVLPRLSRLDFHSEEGAMLDGNIHAAGYIFLCIYRYIY